MIRLALCEYTDKPKAANDGIFLPDTNFYNVEELQEIAEGWVREEEGIELYVNGPAVALVAVINACCKYGVKLTVFHTNSITGGYYPQCVLTQEDMNFVLESEYKEQSCRYNRDYVSQND